MPTTEANSPTAAPMSEADRAAHEAASYVRRPQPTPDLPPLPAEQASRRRAMRVRGW